MFETLAGRAAAGFRGAAGFRVGNTGLGGITSCFPGDTRPDVLDGVLTMPNGGSGWEGAGI